jgi:hypothetical protein
MGEKEMPTSGLLVGIASAAIFVSSALAEDHPCAQPQDPFVVALCSDPDLRATADQQRDEMMALWNRLSPQDQDKFRKDQLAWRSFTARRCRVDRPMPLPLSAETKICLGQAEAGRIAYLQHYGQTDAPMAQHPNATAQDTPTASTLGSAYQDGLRDRAEWERWFNSLQGDYKTGAFHWASHRSLPQPGSCQQMNGDFYAGCTAATAMSEWSFSVARAILDIPGRPSAADLTAVSLGNDRGFLPAIVVDIRSNQRFCLQTRRYGVGFRDAGVACNRPHSPAKQIDGTQPSNLFSQG